MPCWNTEFFLVLQMIKSAHCTMTIDTKKQYGKCTQESFCHDTSIPVHRNLPSHLQQWSPKLFLSPKVSLARSRFRT